MKLIPPLRFKEFDETWVTKRYEDIFSHFRSGKGITSDQITNKGEYPVFGGNGLRGYTNRYTHEGFYLLIGRQGALCGNINTVNGKVYISEHAIAGQGNDESDTFWLAQILEYKKLNRLSESSAQPGLSVEKLLREKLTIPSLPEQRKIADFLSAVDEKIRLLTEKKAKLETYKKGVMQKLFPKAGQTNPELRFKRPDGSAFPDWEEKRLGEVFQRITDKNKEDNQNVLTISAQQGLISQLEFFNKSVSAKDLTGYYILEKGDFAYNKSYSNGYPLGAIKRLDRYDKGVVSTLYICFRMIEDSGLNYWEHYFDAGQLNHEISKIAQEGARNHGLLNMSVVEFFRDIVVKVPSLEEMEICSKFLDVLKAKVQLAGVELDQMKDFKKGLLQQMFV